MANDDDLPSGPDDDNKVVPLTTRAERLVDIGLLALEKDVAAASDEQFMVQLASIFEEMREAPFGPASFAAATLGVGLSDIGRARLPERYRDAVAALRACENIDVAHEFGSKAAALATYARMAKDRELLAIAYRIRAHAFRRVGQLLAEVKAARGANQNIRAADHPNVVVPTRKDAAAEASLSAHQAKQALRIAAIPPEEFERAVEADNPATLTGLAARGKRPAVVRPRSDTIDDTTWIEVDFHYARGLSIEEIATERSLAALMAAWKQANPAAQQRFLATIGCTINAQREE